MTILTSFFVLWSFLQKLCRGLLTVLRRSDLPLCQSTCLETLRILSRDKRVLGPVATREGVLTLAGLARIRVAGHDGEPLEEAQSAEEERVVVEALKCLCNVVFNSVSAQQVGADLQLAEGLCACLHLVSSSHHEVGLFSLRLLFLLSALRTDVRGTLRKEVGAVRLLTNVLERTLDVHWVGPYEAAPPDPAAPPISLENNERAMEALKALFNITMSDSSDEVRLTIFVEQQNSIFFVNFMMLFTNLLYKLTSTQDIKLTLVKRQMQPVTFL